MQLYHQNCPRLTLFLRLLRGRLKGRGSAEYLRGRNGHARLWLRHQSEPLLTRTYVCEACGCQVHVDMDWTEGAKVEEKATLA